MTANLLTQIIFLPLVTALLLIFIPRRFERISFWIGSFVSTLVFGLTLLLYRDFAVTDPGFQFVEIRPWIKEFNITYYVGIDGISLILLILTALLSAIAMFYSSFGIRQRRKEFVISLLILETAMLGTFSALDLFLFYVFWEGMLVPMYLMIGIYGGPRRIYATLKFFIYTMAGSVLMLAAILVTYWLHKTQFGYASTAIPDLYRVSAPFSLQLWLFGAFAFAFAIKIPMFPFHTWLPDAHVEAPTAGSVLLAGILLKMGGYGLIRLAMPLFPQAAQAYAPMMGVLAVIGIVYGAYVAMAQEDVKKLIAYSSVSHMGFVVLGLSSATSLGVQGAVFQMIAHGISTGSLFLLIGMIYDQRHTRMLTDFGGLARVVPRYATAFFVITLSSIGFPGLSGFVGEFQILMGTFHTVWFSQPTLLVAFALLGTVLGAFYMLRLYERMFLGEIRYEENRKLRDLRWPEVVSLAIPLVATLWLGLQPKAILDYVSPSAQKLISQMREKTE